MKPATRLWLIAIAWGVAWLAARSLQIELVEYGTGNDVYLYQRYAESWGRGQGPYVDFHPEYPAGALPVFLAPLLVFGRGDYVLGFAYEMMLFDLGALALVVAWVRRAHPGRWRAELLSGAGYLIGSAALFPVMFSRFDLVPGVILCAALYAVYSPLPWLGALLLGVAAGVKLWPLALFPLFFGLAYRRGGLREAALASVQIGGGVLLALLPVLPRAGFHVFDFLKFHAARGIQIESSWSTIALIANALSIAEAHPVHEFGAFHVAGPLATWLNRLSVPALLAMALVPQWLAFRGELGRERDRTGAIGLIAALAAVLGFMVGGKVLSPQYLLWVVPFLPLFVLSCEGNVKRALLAVAACAALALTSLVYPYWSPALEQREEGHVAALFAVGTRNLLLIALYAVALVRLRKPAQPA